MPEGRHCSPVSRSVTRYKSDLACRGLWITAYHMSDLSEVIKRIRNLVQRYLKGRIWTSLLLTGWSWKGRGWLLPISWSWIFCPGFDFGNKARSEEKSVQWPVAQGFRYSSLAGEFAYWFAKSSVKQHTQTITANIKKKHKYWWKNNFS